jgi:hypothetical protein
MKCAEAHDAKGMKVKVVEHSAKKYRADSKKGSAGWPQDVSDTNIRYWRAHAKRRMGNGYLML